MKKNSFKTVLTSAIIFCLPTFGFSQADNQSVAYQAKENVEAFAAFNTNNATETSAANVNAKALNDFTKKFNGVRNAKWYEASGGFIAGFTENGIETKVIYDHKGSWHSMLRTYGEDKLAFDVRDLVKSKYYDYSIQVVYEITHTDNLTYILKIEDSKRIKTLRITDGNMEVIAD